MGGYWRFVDRKRSYVSGDLRDVILLRSLSLELILRHVTSLILPVTLVNRPLNLAVPQMARVSVQYLPTPDL
jgi:hypothetical protein